MEFDANSASDKFEKLLFVTNVLDNLIRDAISFLQIKLKSDMIDGQYVGIISGNFRRSHQPTRTNPLQWGIRQSRSIAPYGPIVWARVRKRFGEGLYEIMARLFGPEVVLYIGKELQRFSQSVREKVSYRYQNPFPA